MSKTVVLIIQEYLSTTLNRISDWQGYTFAQKSYSSWAAEELLDYLRLHPKTPPLLAVEEFRDKMDKYSLMNKETSYIFSVAHDMAENIIDLML